MTAYKGVDLSELPQNHYSVIVADPPWRFTARSDKGKDRSAEKHYSTMTLEDIKALPVKNLAAKNCVLFMWVVDTHAEMAFEVIKAWGFKYKTIGLYWAKTNKDGSFFTGLGFWTRANPEHAYLAYTGDEQGVERLLLATTGQPTRQSKSVKRLLVTPRQEHSRKPDASFSSVEALVAGPYLELFSRAGRPGWDSWGHEAGKFTDTKTESAQGDYWGLV